MAVMGRTEREKTRQRKKNFNEKVTKERPFKRYSGRGPTMTIRKSKQQTSCTTGPIARHGKGTSTRVRGTIVDSDLGEVV